MDLTAAIERLVDERVRQLLAEHVCPCQREPERRVLHGDGSSLADDIWFTTAEAAAYTKRARGTIHQHAAAGTLRSTQAGRGRGRRYRREWLDEWLQQPVRRPPRVQRERGRSGSGVA